MEEDGKKEEVKELGPILLPPPKRFAGPVTKILFIDFYVGRHRNFYVKGDGVSTRYVDKWDTLKRVINEEIWDIIFLPSYFPINNFGSRDGAAPDELRRMIEARPVLPKLIVYLGYMYAANNPPPELKAFFPLRDKGVLLGVVPWIYHDPSRHVRVKLFNQEHSNNAWPRL